MIEKLPFRQTCHTFKLWLGLLAVIGLMVSTITTPVIAGKKSYGFSLFGELKYKEGFSHFDYANPQAPKGGRITTIGSAAANSFDSFNQFIRKGVPAQGLSFLYDSLMVRAFDEEASFYGLVAKQIELHDDQKGVSFYLNRQARFADGVHIKASDIVYTITTLKTKGKPQYRLALQNIDLVEAPSNHHVRIRFKGSAVRDLPILVGTLPILPEHFYKKHTFEQTSLVPPLGSGPYKIGTFHIGQSVTLQRRDDYWAKDHPTRKGHYNFDQIKFDYFRDRTAEFEGLKAGVFDLREEFTSRDWATKYTFSSVKKGLMKLKTMPDKNPSGAQGFFFNLRRDKFKDVRVREAIGLLFDFEWTNKNLFYSLYQRTESFFENSPLKASGKPSKAELALLTPYQNQLPKTVFEEPIRQPISNGSGKDRTMLRRATQLLKEAGYEFKQGKAIHKATGKPLVIEFLTYSPSFTRIINPIIRNMKAVGIKGSVRLVDSSQYQERLKSFDFDITTSRFTMRLTPGVELKNFFGSHAANAQGSFNLSGINSPVVDGLINHILAAKTYDELKTATQALDRVLRASHYWIPQWYKAAHNIAYWDKFDAPSLKPKYARGILDLWWYDKKRAANLAAERP